MRFGGMESEALEDVLLSGWVDGRLVAASLKGEQPFGYQGSVGAFNEVAAEVRCPRCGGLTTMVVNLYFGLRNQIRYSLGDQVEWVNTRLGVQNGGRPSEGNLDGEGYAECPLCKKDFFLVAEIRGDRLVRVRPDLQRQPLIPD
jgi:hypothetical protein